jgi:DNA-binding HxlR family transcriptional regulator
MTDSTVTLTGRLEPRSGWEATGCTITKTLDLLGSRSAFLLLREAFYGTKRFDDFAHRVGISEPVAAARLKELVHVGLLEKRPYKEPGQRTRFEYHLTEMGVDFFPSLVALMQWGDRWLGPAGVEMKHHDCGGSVQAQLRCLDGHPVTVGDIDLVVRARQDN